MKIQQKPVIQALRQAIEGETVPPLHAVATGSHGDWPVTFEYLLENTLPVDDEALSFYDTMRKALHLLNLEQHLDTQREWSTKTFGPAIQSERLMGVLDHILKEVEEVRANPNDLEEWIDIIILACDGAWRAGHSPREIAEALQDKLAKNMQRSWPDWRKSDPNKAMEHTNDES